MINFKPLASGSSGNAYLVTDGNTPLLLEAGLRIRELRKKANFSMGQIHACLVSHEHQDHCCGVHELMRAGIDVYTSRGTAQALGLAGHRLHVIQAKRKFKLGSWAILPFETKHDAAEPLGFLLASKDGGKLLFATDTQFVKYRFQGLTHIALEANFSGEILKQNVAQGQVPHEVAKGLWGRHMSLEAAKDFLAANDCSKVQEIHLLHLSDKNSDAEAFRAQVEAQTGKPAFVANEL